MTGRLILVIGSGRSGTHWVGHLLDSHPGISATIEEPTFFAPVTAMAMDPRLRRELLPKLVDDYRARIDSVSPRDLADKSHPNIWLAESLAEAFPDARFVGIQRRVEGTVASMLKHQGVLSWHDRWQEFPVPNRFLGITEANASTYGAMSTIAKCVLRWASHRDRMLELRDVLGESLLVLDYEDLIVDPAPSISALAGHLELSEPFPAPEVKSESLDRWRNELSPEQLGEIAEALAVVERESRWSTTS